MKHILLSRDSFREAVFERDNHTCIFCDRPAEDAHHIIERKLWSDGGYYLANGASVCSEHHIACEMTTISVEQVREAAGITKTLVPDVMYEGHNYDKWGNPILANGTRTRGPLFYDLSVQKILAKGGFLEDFTHYVKASKTMHLPWSQGIHDDDRIIRDFSGFEGKEVIATVKMDGENTSMYPDYFHARSIDGRNHPSRSWAKSLWGQICGDIPTHWRITGENVYAQHSIAYDNLESYFYGFGVWNERNERLHWDQMLEWFELLGITPVPLYKQYRGIWDEELVRHLWDERERDHIEGFVITTVEGFPYGEYHNRVAKVVRKNHVQTNKHWMHGQPIVPNKLKSS